MHCVSQKMPKIRFFPETLICPLRLVRHHDFQHRHLAVHHTSAFQPGPFVVQLCTVFGRLNGILAGIFTHQSFVGLNNQHSPVTGVPPTKKARTPSPWHGHGCTHECLYPLGTVAYKTFLAAACGQLCSERCLLLRFARRADYGIVASCVLLCSKYRVAAHPKCTSTCEHTSSRRCCSYPNSRLPAAV